MEGVGVSCAGIVVEIDVYDREGAMSYIQSNVHAYDVFS